MTRFLPDRFTMMLVATVILASLLPISGQPAVYFGLATKLAIALLFFLHGARLSRDVVIAGILHWRLHMAILLVTFGLFPLLGVAIGLPQVRPSNTVIGCAKCTTQQSTQTTQALTRVRRCLLAECPLDDQSHFQSAGMN